MQSPQRPNNHFGNDEQRNHYSRFNFQRPHIFITRFPPQSHSGNVSLDEILNPMMAFLFDIQNIVNINAQFPSNTNEPKGFSQEEMQKLPIISHNNPILKDASCAICLESFKNVKPTDTIRGMPSCSQHAYHENCIFEWLKQSRNCPLCRSEVIFSDTGKNDQNQKPAPEIIASLSDSQFFLDAIEDGGNSQPPRANDDVDNLQCQLEAIECCWEERPTRVGEECVSSPFIRMSECGHVFHRPCVESFMRIQGERSDQNRVKCPSCRHESSFDNI
jgi:ribosomal protein S27E